jgi:hypothetical protein
VKGLAFLRGVSPAFVQAALATFWLWAIFAGLLVAAVASVASGRLPETSAIAFAYGYVGVMAVTWLSVFLFLICRRDGRAYLTREASTTLGYHMGGRAEDLTIAGLVLAGLTLGTTTSEAAGLLTVGFACFLTAFATGSWFGRNSSEVAMAAARWLGLAALVGGVFLAPLAASLVGRMAVAVAGIAVALYALVDAQARVRLR